MEGIIGICLMMLFGVGIPCCGLWLARYRVASILVGTMVTLGLAINFLGMWGICFFLDDSYIYYLAIQSLTLGGGLILAWYGLVIMRHMLFSKTMPWSNKNNMKPENDS